MIINLFATPVYQSKLAQKQDLKGTIQEVLKIQQIDHAGKKWSKKNYDFGYTSYGSMDQLHRFSTTFDDLEKQIKRHIKNYIQILEWDVSLGQLKMSSMWVNVMPQGAHHSFHLHPHSVISGTYYLQVPKGSSCLQIEDPRLSRRMAAPPLLEKTIQNHHSISPNPGDLVLFESWLRHQVPTQKVKQERISISFNYDWIKN
jgi:uncharacterized protein (TIGR02466 family)